MKANFNLLQNHNCIWVWQTFFFFIIIPAYKMLHASFTAAVHGLLQNHEESLSIFQHSIYSQLMLWSTFSLHLIPWRCSREHLGGSIVSTAIKSVCAEVLRLNVYTTQAIIVKNIGIIRFIFLRDIFISADILVCRAYKGHFCKRPTY